ncbi:MAG: CDP-alcohol phosphatidyltransferase family protein [Defluviitaleaceae bacterium]|nr:CDP-alcohol phosphatidyltransferase family protein [Defluviitaleaceae bacterium]
MKKFFPVLQFLNVPNGITTLGLIFGIVACYFLVQHNLQFALIFVLLSLLMDLFDGFFAYKLHQQTEFGQYVDSLVDFFICCIIPIWVIYIFVGSHPILVIALVFYCICGLWRLAYYNIVCSKEYFVGLPVPGAMLVTTMVLWLVVSYNIPSWVLYIALFLTGFLMISAVQLKKYGFWQKTLWLFGCLFLVLIIIT